MPCSGECARDVLRSGRLVRPHRVVAGQIVEAMTGEERVQRQMTAVLLADDHHHGRPVDPCRRQGPHRVPQAGSGVQDDHRRAVVGDCPAGGDTNNRPFVQGKTNFKSSGRSVSREISVDPGLEKSVVPPRPRSTSNAASRTVRMECSSLNKLTAVRHCQLRSRLLGTREEA